MAIIRLNGQCHTYNLDIAAIDYNFECNSPASSDDIDIHLSRRGLLWIAPYRAIMFT